MKYDSFSYLWPPRPDKAISPDMLGMIETQGFVAQAKLNGTCSVIAVSPEGEIKAMNRHKEDHKLWTPKRELMKPFANLKGSGWYVFVAELLHSKVAGLRDINYVHDVLVANGDYLVGRTQAQRQAVLRSIFPIGGLEETISHYVVDPHTWVAREYTKGFRQLFDSLDRPEHEGLVLKNPKAPLGLCLQQKSNNAGMLKARKTHKNYSF